MCYSAKISIQYVTSPSACEWATASQRVERLTTHEARGRTGGDLTRLITSTSAHNVHNFYSPRKWQGLQLDQGSNNEGQTVCAFGNAVLWGCGS